MPNSEWDLAIVELERATARLEAAMPTNTPLIEDALQRRAVAIERIRTITTSPEETELARLQTALQAGDQVRERLVLSREQLRDGIARLNQSSYLTHAFNEKPGDTRRAFDCEA